MMLGRRESPHFFLKVKSEKGKVKGMVRFAQF